MKRIITWIVSLSLITILAFPLSAMADALSAQQLYQKVKGSIYTLYSLDYKTREVKARGTAVAVSKTMLVTNCHVALSGNYLLVQIPESKKPMVAKLYYQNPRKDICLLEIPGGTFSAVKIRPSASVEIGEVVYAVGNPKGTEKSISKGIVSNKHLVQGGIWLQTDAVIYFGSSGGGLFDEEGNLIGITTKMGGNFGFALPTEWVVQAMAPSSNRHAMSSTRNVNADTHPEAIQGLLKLGVYGKDKVTLYKNNRECFLLIEGKDTNGEIASILLWNPKFDKSLLVFPTTIDIKKAMNIIYDAVLEKRMENQKNYRSDSLLYIAEQPYPLYGTKTIEKKYPFLVTQFSESLRPIMLNGRAFRVIFKDADPSIGSATIIYELNGVAETLSAFNIKCQ